MLIKPKAEIKILGIYVDENLNWNKQIKYAKKKAMNAILNLNRMKHILPERTKIFLYNAIVTPHLSYADVVWNDVRKRIQQNYKLHKILRLEL